MDKNLKHLQGGGQNQQPNINVDMSKASDVECKCGNDTFTMAFRFKKLSAIASPTGKELMIPMQVFKCRKCGLEFNPESE